MAKGKRQKRNVKTTLRDVLYQEGPPREPFPQLKSRQARNYRREKAATEANDEFYEYEESVYLLYTKLRKARKAGDKKLKEIEAAFQNQVARYIAKNQTEGQNEQSDIDISDFDVDSADLEDNSLLNAYKELTTPSLVVANENEPFVGRDGKRFLNTELYNNNTTLNNATILNMSKFKSPKSKFASDEHEPVASTPYLPSIFKNS